MHCRLAVQHALSLESSAVLDPTATPGVVQPVTPPRRARWSTIAGDPAEASIRSAIAAHDHPLALARIWAVYGVAIRRRARRIVLERTAAEDVVQEALMRIYSGLDTIRTGTSIRAWVMRVVTHRAVDELRQRNRRLGRQLDGFDPRLCADSESAETPLAAVEEWLVLQECLARLPRKARISVVLHFGGELSIADLGALLHEQDGTVRTRIARAMDRLRDPLARRGVTRSSGQGARQRSVPGPRRASKRNQNCATGVSVAVRRPCG